MKYFILITFIFSICLNLFGAETCSLKLYPETYYPSNIKQVSPVDFFKSTNCKYNVQKQLLSILLRFNTTLNSKYIENLINKKLQGVIVKVSPKKFKVFSIENFLGSKLKLSNNQKFINSYILNKSHLIQVNTNERLSIYCSDCYFSGNKNIKLIKYNTKAKRQHTEWINGVVAEKVTVLSTTRSLNNISTGIKKDSFKSKVIYAVKPEVYFSNHKDLPFYKLNKSLKKDTPLKNSDVIPLNLVKYGYPSQVVFSKNGIKLTGTAIPVKNGKFNELIKLKRKNNKIITGKVINFNKVRVEL